MRKLRKAVVRNGGKPKLAFRTTSVIMSRLFALLEEQDIVQNSVADALGVTAACVTQWKMGRANPSLLSAEELAQLLGYKLVLVPIGENNDT